MRSQFNKGGTNYHLILSPVVHPAITIHVPSNQGTLLESRRGVIATDINISWWSAQIQNLDTSLGYIDPTHLPIYLTNNVMLYIGTNPLNCCVIGYHGAAKVTGNGGGSVNGNGNNAVQTFAWASYVTPGFFNPTADWALQDIHAISHEIAEWGDDIGFAMGTNGFEQGTTPNGTQVADGYYHPEDEVFLPWFMRSTPSNAEGGRYTLMGSLNPYPGFRAPATGC